MKKDFILHLERALNLEILSLMPLYGGCINRAFKIETESCNYFLKINSYIDLFPLEERGLAKLKSTNTFYIPEVIIFNKFKENYYLIMEFIESDHPKDNFWKLFGQKLAALHMNFGKRFGLEYNNYIGPLLQENTFCSNAVDFFINYRILPQVRILEKRLSVNLYSDFNRLFKFLPDIIPLENPHCYMETCGMVII